MFVDKILYINLQRRPDRNENVQKIVNDHGLNDITVRIDAVDGRGLTKDNISKDLITKEGIDDAFNSKQRVYVPLTIGGIGCALSHKKCYEYIVNNNIQKCLILEDDIRVDDKFVEKINSLEKIVPKDFDMFFLGFHGAHALKQVSYDYFIPTRIYGLFGYIVTYEGAKKLLNIFPITEQIDSEIPKSFDKIKAYSLHKVNAFIYSDPSATTTTFGTDIQIRENYEPNFHFEANIILIILMCFVLVYLFRLHFIKKN
jgi:GR25 family glycosyltransferase involved in LPS biosynthesis